MKRVSESSTGFVNVLVPFPNRSLPVPSVAITPRLDEAAYYNNWNRAVGT